MSGYRGNVESMIIWGGALSFRGRGVESPLLPVAKRNADRLMKHGYALLTINDDQDRPDAFKPLHDVLKSRIVTLDDTNHNLGKYYERAADTMIDFLAERLNYRSSGREQVQRNE